MREVSRSGFAGSQVSEGSQSAFDRAAGSGISCSFSIRTLMLVIATLAVSLGIARHFPGIGIPTAIIFVPVCIRTSGMTERSRRAGRPMDAAAVARVFFSSAAIMTLACAASLIAFALTCVPLSLSVFVLDGPQQPFYYVAWGIGIVAGLVVAYLILRRWWAWQPHVDERLTK